MTRPFADAVVAYAQAGWPAIMPVPVDKHPPPVGFTGAEGRDTTPTDLVQWTSTHADSSIALRMPDGVIGIDVDHYAKGTVTKTGGHTLHELMTQHGPLPATWTSTARGEGPSRIHFYRVPVGRYRTKFPDIEIIQRHHRYAVVWPSPHPDAGDIYRWYDPTGQVTEAPPKPLELPELPEAWVAALREGATDQTAASADVASGQALLAQLEADTRPACAEITNAALVAIEQLAAADAGARHDTMTERTHQLIQLAAVGHPGVAPVLVALRDKWAELTTGEDRSEEFERMLLTTARKAVTAVGGHQVANDPCTIVGEIAVAAPAPGDDRPGHTPPEPVAPIRALHPFEVIGTHAFDPAAGLDQSLAEKVLERMYPAMRFAHDAKAWLLRGRTHWETRPDLAEWAVALLADLMPRGNPDAEKGSDAREQADRRKRFMSASTSGAVARKLRAVVAGGSHPASLALAELDSEPWLLWAGGVGWDLTASLDGPVAALIDPSTPHLHSAGVAPELRETPLWDAFTAAVWPDEELRAWALRVLSIALTGYPDAALPILIGPTGRGKTQVVELISSVMGSYAHAADARLLGGADRAHASILYALKGRRLSFIDEAPRDSHSGQERLKQLTGGGLLTANQMNQNPITFRPTHTLVLTANDAPVLTDPAVRRRTRLIPCEADPAQVRAARKAIGDTSGAAWRREAPGVLAALMREAAAWLADRDSALTTAAPEAYRFRAEEIAAEQDLTGTWLREETEPFEAGTRSRELYEAFVGWSRNGNVAPSRIPSETKWGRDLTGQGYPPLRSRDANRRALRLKLHGGWLVEGSRGGLGVSAAPNEPPVEKPVERGGFASAGGGLVDGSGETLHTPETSVIPDENGAAVDLCGGLEGYMPSIAQRTPASHAHKALTGANPPPSTQDQLPESAKITARLLEGRTQALVQQGEPAPPAAPSAPTEPAGPATPKRTRLTDAEKAQRAQTRTEQRAAGKAAERMGKIAAASGELVELPAAVTRDGTVRAVTVEQLPELLAAFGGRDELTVDVEHSGYPVGHPDYALRTIQLGNEHLALVLDADDPAQLEAAAEALAGAPVLHAHSAQADLVPLAHAGLLDAAEAFERMHDTVLPAKLLDPASTGSDPDLKGLSANVLGDAATSPGADDARAALFKAGGWLVKTLPTTPITRSGWAQTDRRSTTMVRYAGSDVLDGAALARVFYGQRADGQPRALPADLLERERTAQRLTARVADVGLRIDGEHVRAMIDRVRPQLDDAGQRLRSFGVADPGSDRQVAAVALQLGARLPRTDKGNTSVAKGALDRYRAVEGPLGDFVTARLDYQRHETALGLFLEPYRVLTEHGDGRARPTVYTLEAKTGRMSCVRPNLQQVTREGGFRGCITADPGQVIISADFASVEVRAMAALSQDQVLTKMLAEGADLHSIISAQAFGPEWTKSDRYMVKRGVFGWAYGGGIPTLAAQVGCSESIMAAIVDTLATIAPEYVRWAQGIRQAVKNGHTKFPAYSGRVIHLAAPHAAPNYAIQGTARELLVDTLMRLDQTKYRTNVMLPVHDEVLLVVDESDADNATQTLVDAMETDLFGVAIKAEASEPSFYWKDAS